MEVFFMARPIEQTPEITRKKDVERFYESLSNAKNDNKKAELNKKAVNTYQKMKKRWDKAPFSTP